MKYELLKKITELGDTCYQIETDGIPKPEYFIDLDKAKKEYNDMLRTVMKIPIIRLEFEVYTKDALCNVSPNSILINLFSEKPKQRR